MRTTITILSLLVATLVAVATLTALVSPGGEPVAFTTVRGELALLQAAGPYRDLPVALAREGLVWDWINLLVGVPALVLALIAARCGSLRGRLALAGLSLYYAYTYLTFATLIFNALFPAYVAIIALSLVTLFIVLGTLDPEQVRRSVSDRFPRRFFAGFAFASAAVITLLWSARIAEIFRSGHFPPELAGLTALETQALDLGLVVPLSLTSGILLLRGQAWGYVLTALQLTFGFMMFLTIPAWIAVPLIRDGQIRAWEAAPFLVLCVVGFTLVAVFLRNVDDRARLTPT